MTAFLPKLNSILPSSSSSRPSSKNLLPGESESFKQKLIRCSKEKQPDAGPPLVSGQVTAGSVEIEPVTEEQEKQIAELLEKGEIPSLHELAFFLQTDIPTLTEALQKNELNWLLVLTGINQTELHSDEVPVEKESSQSKQKTAALAHKAVQIFQPFLMQSGTEEKKAGSLSLQHQKALEMAFAHYQTQNSEENKETARVVHVFEPAFAFSPLMSKAEQYHFHAQPKAFALNAEQFTEKFMGILQKASLSHMPLGTKLLIKLYPEQLGSLRIELLQQNGVMTAKLVSSTQAVKELLEQNVHQLKQAFNQQSIKVDQVDVSSWMEKQHHDKNPHEQKHQQKNSEQPNVFTEEEALFETILLELKLEA